MLDKTWKMVEKTCFFAKTFFHPLVVGQFTHHWVPLVTPQPRAKYQLRPLGQARVMAKVVCTFHLFRPNEAPLCFSCLCVMCLAQKPIIFSWGFSEVLILMPVSVHMCAARGPTFDHICVIFGHFLSNFTIFDLVSPFLLLKRRFMKKVAREKCFYFFPRNRILGSDFA